MTARRLLVVSYFHPPFPGSGGNRWLSMARHLRAAGHEVTILASDAFGRLSDEHGVVRARDLKASPALRRALARGRLPAPGGAPALEPPAPAVLTKVFVPDAHVASWLPGAVVAARRLVRDVDCLVTSGPPDSGHLVGLALGRRRPAWIADFRDGWNYEPLREPFPTRAQRALDRALERRVAREAEVAIGVTRPIADDLARRLNAHAAWVPNGWDPEAAPPPAASSSPVPEESSTSHAGSSPAAESVVTLVHTGTLSGSWGRDPEPLLRALRAVSSDPPLRLVLAGRLTPRERELIDRTGVGYLVRHEGMLERPQALALQRAAGALVLLTSRNASEATSKVFEYIAAGRPIVALAEGNEAARIVDATNTGVTVPPDDVDAIASALRRVASGDLARAYAPRDLERFTYPGPAEAVAALVEEAVARRATA